ncbi:hypothetical protein HPY42_03615 [Coprothermobacteraceae bacterium]|nr:hypothetical protein [Coprothermobacteraceae bacterium]
MRYRLLIGVATLLALIGLSYYVTYKPWNLWVQSPPYGWLGLNWHKQVSFSEATALYAAGFTQVRFDLRTRSLLFNIDLPKPLACIELKGVSRVVTDQGLLASDLYAQSICVDRIRVNQWNEETRHLVERLLALGYDVDRVECSRGIYVVTGRRDCGPGTIKVIGSNIDRLEQIKPYWNDCTYKEYRLLYDSGAVLR